MQADLVIDASVILAWYDPNEINEYAEGVLDSLADKVAVAPTLCALEVNNILRQFEQRCFMTKMESDKVLMHLTNVQIRLRETEESFYVPFVKDLAEDHDLTMYDATYLELALTENLPLATLDGKLLEAMERLGVPRA